MKRDDFETLYRYSNIGDRIILDEFPITKSTPCGSWINVYGTKKFVLKTSIKQYAYVTKEEALASFIQRKTRQITILSYQLESARVVLEEAKRSTVENIMSFKDYELEW